VRKKNFVFFGKFCEISKICKKFGKFCQNRKV
jgi:hypothetical protein